MQPLSNKTVVVTGANRGIGLALVEQSLALGANLIAGVREPKKATALRSLYNGERLRIFALDVQNQDSVDAFAKAIGGESIHILFNNAGINLDAGRRVAQLPASALAQTFDTNTLGPYRVLQALLPCLSHAERPVIANISSVMGSLSENRSGGHIGYRVSKTALNMLTLCIALDDKKIIALALHPGWVETRMGGKHAEIDIHTSARGLLDVVIGAKPSDSGTFIRYNGERIAW